MGPSAQPEQPSGGGGGREMERGNTQDETGERRSRSQGRLLRSVPADLQHSFSLGHAQCHCSEAQLQSRTCSVALLGGAAPAREQCHQACPSGSGRARERPRRRTLVPQRAADCEVGERDDLAVPERARLLIGHSGVAAVAAADLSERGVVDVVFAVPLRALVLVFQWHPCLDDGATLGNAPRDTHTTHQNQIGP